MTTLNSRKKSNSLRVHSLEHYSTMNKLTPVSNGKRPDELHANGSHQMNIHYDD